MDVYDEGIRLPLCVPLKKNTKKYELGTPDTHKNQHTLRTGAVGPCPAMKINHLHGSGINQGSGTAEKDGQSRNNAVASNGMKKRVPKIKNRHRLTTLLGTR